MNQTKVVAEHIKYLRLSKHPLGGWDYTLTKIGEVVLDLDLSVDAFERYVRQHFPKANRFTLCERNTRFIDGEDCPEWVQWFYGNC